MKHKIKTQSEPTQFYISERISVKASLLHPYVAQPGFIPYQKWVDSLQGIRDSYDATRDLRTFSDRDGQLGGIDVVELHRLFRRIASIRAIHSLISAGLGFGRSL